MLNVPDPTLNKLLNNDGSDDRTIIATNISRCSASASQASDDDTADTEPSTDEDATESDIENSASATQAGLFIPQHTLPWGGRSASKLSRKWARRISERENRRRRKQASNPRFKSRGEVWRQIVKASEFQHSANSSMMFNTRRLVHLVKYALSDSGASSHFLIKGSPAVNVKVAAHPISIKLPDGSIIHSSHTCNLDIPWLPKEMTEAHIVPGLDHSSLISTKKFCEAGCKVVFDEEECRVYYNNELVLCGGRDKKTEMWQLPINPVSKNNRLEGLDLMGISQAAITSRATAPRASAHSAQAMINSLYTLPYKHQQLKYMHQSFFSPPIQTISEAASNNQLHGIPCLNSPAMVKKYLAPSPATSKGRLKKQRSNVRTTRPKKRGNTITLAPEVEEPATTPSTTNTDANIIIDTHSTSNVFCCAALGDATTGTFYTDMTGAFPVTSLENMQSYFVAYDYDTNTIFANPCPDFKDETIITAFKEVFNELKSKGYAPQFNVTDNQATVPIKAFLKTQECKWQFVEPSNHRVNAAERAIQTFKNHFISGLSSTDLHWPLQLWDHLSTQATLTLNLLRTSRIDPTKSAYEQLNGHKYDWNAHPLAPPGTRAVIYIDSVTRTSWGPRGLDAWYCGPAMDHYRCSHFFVPETGAMRISGSYDLFPQHCIMPTFTREQHATAVNNELNEAISSLDKKAKRRLLKAMAVSMENLATKADAPPQRVDVPATSEGDPRGQRVGPSPPVTTTTNPTAPAVVQIAPRTHQRNTRHNTPGITTPIERPAVTKRKSPRLNAGGIDNSPTFNSVPNSNRIPSFSHHNIISQEAVNQLTQMVWDTPGEEWMPRDFLDHSPTERATQENFHNVNIDHFCAAMVHPDTGETITQYKKLARDSNPKIRETWQTGFGKEIGRMAQGDSKTGTKGKNCIFVMDHAQIAKMYAEGKAPTYARIVVDFRPQKADPNRVRITAGGNLIKCPGELTTRTADITTTKIVWNSVISTDGARYACLDVGDFYLETPLEKFEYMKMPLALFPEWTRKQYDLDAKAHKGFVYWEIRKAIYGLPNAGRLANERLRQKLKPAGFYEVAHTPGLWKHKRRPIQFSLIVDDFGVKFVGKEHIDFLITSLRNDYARITVDWTGELYAGIALKWNYQERWVDASMDGYVRKLRQRFGHKMPRVPQHSPYKAPKKVYGAAAQDTIPPDDTAKLDDDKIKLIQQVIGVCLYYGRAVDDTILPALSAIASEQSEATKNTMAKTMQLLDYLATHPEAKIRYHASDMVLNIHSDASYLSETRARSRLAGYFFLGDIPRTGENIRVNGNIFVSCGILRIVVCSAAEAELGALFLNIKEGKVLRLALIELGHIQPPTPVHCDNSTAAGIANDTVKKQRSRSMEMRFFWVTDQVMNKQFDVQWHPGKENLADYFTKHFDTKHHQSVRPWYVHEQNSPRELPRAAAPKALRGCVGILDDGYTKAGPLPRINPIRRVTPSRITLAKLGRAIAASTWHLRAHTRAHHTLWSAV